MITAVCQHEQLAKHGKDRKGAQRWKCRRCGVTVVRDNHERPLGDMRIDLNDAVRVVQLLLEGVSIRAAERITGMKRDTICDLILQVGQKCDRLLEGVVVGVPAKFVEVDEIWGFVLCKEKNAKAKHFGEEAGDAWTWFAIDAETKLILSHATGKRDQSTCDTFLSRLNGATTGPMQITSDGLAL